MPCEELLRAKVLSRISLGIVRKARAVLRRFTYLSSQTRVIANACTKRTLGMSQIKVLAAAKALSDHWFPINPVVHTVVAAKFRKGAYKGNSKLLASDLMSDLALFGYCLRKLLTLSRQGKIKKMGPFAFDALMEECSEEQWAEILAVGPRDISAHELHSPSDHQLACIHQMMLSGAAAEIFGERARFPAGAGFTSAFLRQLGLTLIAWNYPHVLRQAMTEVSRGGSLDEAFIKILGYSPRTLAITIARDWGVPEEVLLSVGDKNSLSVSEDPHTRKLQAAADLMSKICEVGEVLAQVEHPEMFPKARSGWPEARKKIEQMLGKDGVKLIHTRFKECFRGYLLSPNAQFENLVNRPLFIEAPPEPAQAIHTRSEASLQEYPHELRAALESLQKHIQEKKPRKESVLIFSEQIVPSVGFSGGCILMYDFEAKALLSRYRFGSCSFTLPRVGCSALEPTAHPVAQAFRSDRAKIQFDPWSQEGELGFVAQAFGDVQRVGVLYLEIGHRQAQESPEKILSYFAVLRKALQSCLEVK